MNYSEKEWRKYREAAFPSDVQISPELEADMKRCFYAGVLIAVTAKSSSVDYLQLLQEFKYFLKNQGIL